MPLLFFDTHYDVRRPVADVFDLLSDFERYLMDLPEFHGARLTPEAGPLAPGKVYRITVPDGSYPYRTRVEVLECDRPQRFVYEYRYTGLERDQPLSAAEGPMPWDRARVTLQCEALEEGTRVKAQMHVFGVSGFFNRWKTSVLKTASARAQKRANDNMVRVAEKAL